MVSGSALGNSNISSSGFFLKNLTYFSSGEGSISHPEEMRTPSSKSAQGTQMSSVLLSVLTLLWHAVSGFTVCWREPAGSLGREMQVLEGTGPHELCPFRQCGDPFPVCRTRGSVTKVGTTNRDLLMCRQKPVSSVYPRTVYISYCAKVTI